MLGDCLESDDLRFLAGFRFFGHDAHHNRMPI
jgi:hypothetical protein